MMIVMDDGEEMEFGPGDFMTAAPGHDAWIVGDEPCVVIDWHGFSDYAKRSLTPGSQSRRTRRAEVIWVRHRIRRTPRIELIARPRSALNASHIRRALQVPNDADLP